MPTVLSADQVTKVYGAGEHRVEAVRNVSVTVQSGEFVVLMGASGSGKSTLLHLLAGLDIPTRGSIHLNGDPLSALDDRRRTLLRRKQIGIVFQAYNLLPTLTAVENVALPLLITGTPNQDAMNKARHMLGKVDMIKRESHRPEAMSGGEQQRVAIARALVHDPAVILADEPTGNLDSHHAEQIWTLLRSLVGDAGRTIVAVTHEVSGATHADRVIVLKDGQSVGEIQREGDGDAAMVAARYQQLAG